MSRQFLDFEQPIEELKQKIEALRMVSDSHEVSLAEEIEKLEQKSEALMKSVFSNLDDWEVTQMARHPLRPLTSDYIEYIIISFCIN